DKVVVAAGTGAPALLAPLGLALPLLARPGLLLRTHPVAARLGRILAGPFGALRQDREGRLHLPLSVGHQSDDASRIEGDAGALADAALARLGRHLDLPGLAWERVMLGWRPVPADGLPVLGRAGPEGLYLAVMHSGVTLAAGVAEGMTREIMGQGTAQGFAPFSPDRFSA
ncbi:MAG TPA: FAD-binding oxidoreductase, partial [Rhodobacterales bacterium]|nr:FAD-binding oxidoreductase [Rhodobacterales bacterium]